MIGDSNPLPYDPPGRLGEKTLLLKFAETPPDLNQSQKTVHTNPCLKADKLLIAPQGRKGLYGTCFAPTGAKPGVACRRRLPDKTSRVMM